MMAWWFVRTPNIEMCVLGPNLPLLDNYATALPARRLLCCADRSWDTSSMPVLEVTASGIPRWRRQLAGL
jgi:hypothetical protein